MNIKSPYQLTYIWHDCFLMQTASANFIFDFFLDPTQKGDIPEFLRMADNGKPLFVVVSHHHKDHYTREIFSWVRKHPDIHFIISKDVARSARHIITPGTLYNGVRPDPNRVNVVRPGEEVQIAGIKFRAFASTDTGNSWFVIADGLKIFHAGDLNAWIWKDESTQQEINKALGDYNVIINSIAEVTDKFDIVMFPVDSRIGTDYFTGARIFLERFDTDLFLPMHFCLADNEEQMLQRSRDAASFQFYSSERCHQYVLLRAPYDTICRL